MISEYRKKFLPRNAFCSGCILGAEFEGAISGMSSYMKTSECGNILFITSLIYLRNQTFKSKIGNFVSAVFLLA